MSEHESESNCDSEPEVPFCSEEWPSSPPLKFHEELPPNSSSAIPLGTNNPQREDSEGVLVSTAIQREEPILQVERTPYTNGYALMNTSMNPKSHILSTKSNSISTSENLNDSANHKAPYSDSKTNRSSSEASASTPFQDLKPGINRDAIEGSSRNLDLDLVDRQVQDAIDSQSRNEDVEMADQDIQGVIYNEFQSQSGSPIQKTAPASVENIEQLRASLPGNSDQDVSDSCNKRTSEKTKRKSCHVDNQSSHFAKRQKFVKSQKSFNFTQDPQCVSDPSAIGSKNRQEFFECRKRSGTNPPKEHLFRSCANSRITTPNCEFKAQLDHRQFVLPANHEESMDSTCSPPSNSQSLLEEGVDSGVKADKMEPFNSKSHEDNASSRFTANDGSSLQKDGQLIFDKLPVPAILGSGSQDTGSINARNDTAKILAGADAIEESNIYNRFKATYPDYLAPIEQFIAICKRIENLVKEDRMEHQSLWDDFIIRHKTEYPKYLHRCADMAEDPAVYEKFYRNEIDEPRYIRRIVTPRSLHEALLLRNQIASCKVQHSHHKLGDVRERQLFPEKLAMMEPRNLTRASSNQMSSPPLPIIDLTGEREFSPTVEKRSRLLSSKNFSPRSIPWVKSDSSKKASIGTHDRSSQSSHKAILTPPYPNARITKSPPLSKPGSTRSISSAKELSNVSHFEQGHKIDPVKERLGTGIKQTLSDSETQAESLDEQRRLHPASGKGIDHQIATSPFAVHKLPEHQGSHKPSSNRPDPASSESPLFLSESASTKSKSAEAPQPWWKDEQSPFNTFVRAYTGIRAGNGNSFAMVDHSKSNESRGAGKRTQMLEKFDVSRWWI